VHSDVAGEVGTDFTPLVKVWGEVKPAGGGESVQADQAKSEVTHEVLIRWMPLPTDAPGAAWSHLRIYWESEDRTFEIEGARDPYERRTSLLLTCKERT